MKFKRSWWLKVFFVLKSWTWSLRSGSWRMTYSFSMFIQVHTYLFYYFLNKSSFKITPHPHSIRFPMGNVCCTCNRGYNIVLEWKIGFQISSGQVRNNSFIISVKTIQFLSLPSNFLSPITFDNWEILPFYTMYSLSISRIPNSRFILQTTCISIRAFIESYCRPLVKVVEKTAYK